MTNEHESGHRIGRTSATEQHLQTILTALLTAGVIASVGFAWQASNTLERVATRQEEQVKTTDLLIRQIGALDSRVDRIEVDIARMGTRKNSNSQQPRPLNEQVQP